MLSSPRESATVVAMLVCFLFCGGGVASASTSVSIAAQANVDGIGSTGSAVSDGGLDDAGNAYPAALLGTTAVWNGVTFTLGKQNTPDATSSSTVSLPAGKYSTLNLLATGVNGNHPGETFVVTYTDGTSSTFVQSLSDWYKPQNYAGESKALTAAYRIGAKGAIQNGPFYVYGYSFAINSAKTVASVALPRNRFVIVLALSLDSMTSTHVSIAGAANVDGLAKTGAAVPNGGLDDAGHAYSAALLGTSATWAGVSFAFGGADALDAASGSTLSLPAGHYSSLNMLATGVNGNHPNETFLVTYTDGTSSTFVQGVSDWHTPQNYAGESKALTEAYRIGPSGAIQDGPFYVYGYSFAINSAKTIASVALPRNRFVIVLAVTLTAGGSPAVPSAPSAVATPAVPSGLTANAGNAQASLTWTASSGASSYHMKRATTSGGPYTQVGAPTTAAFTNTALTNGTTYYYVVSALNSAGESANSAQVSVAPAMPSPSSCNLTSPAFCDTFDEGPTSTPGREGDLDSTKWSVAHLAPADIGGSGPVANPIRVAPIPSCKASFSSTNVYPPNDTLICDPSGTRGSQLLTGVAIQNYGVNSYMIRQPFDFAGRTGKIEFDLADDSGYEMLGGFPEIDISQDPVPAPTFQEYSNFEAGPVPNNAISVKFFAGGGCGAGVSPINAMTFNGYVPVILPSSGTIGCVSIAPGAMNHYEIQLSQTQIDIYGTDASSDGGQTFPSTLHHLYSAAINLPFTRGYVHIGARNHATIKYHFGPDAIFHWDNIGFDGPVITNTQSYEIPDNTTMGTYGDFSGATIMNLGYQLQDGTVSGKPAGIYDPVNQLPPFQFKNVNISGAVGAQLSFNAFFDVPQYTATTAWGWKYRFNGGTWRTRTLTSPEVSAINSSFAVGGAGSAGNVSMLVSVPTGDLINGTNTFEIVPLNAPMSIPPVIANIDLTLSH